MYKVYINTTSHYSRTTVILLKKQITEQYNQTFLNIIQIRLKIDIYSWNWHCRTLPTGVLFIKRSVCHLKVFLFRRRKNISRC